MPEQEPEPLIQIFRHLKELDALRTQVTKQVRAQPDHWWWKDTPRHPSVEQLGISLKREDDPEVLLRVRSAAQPRPLPPQLLGGWLKPGWEDPAQPPQLVEEQQITQ